MTIKVTGNKDSLVDALMVRIKQEEQRAETEPRQRDKYQHRAYANGLREALELVDAALRSEAEGGPVELRLSRDIFKERISVLKEQTASGPPAN